MGMSSETILLVEGAPQEAQGIRDAVLRTPLPCLVRVLADGRQAIDYLSRRGMFADRKRPPCPAVVLVDMDLKRPTAFELLAWIRSQQRWKHLPVVMLAGSQAIEEIGRAYDLGANSCIRKRNLLEELFVTVRTLVLYWLTLNERPSASDAAANLGAASPPTTATTVPNHCGPTT